MSSNWGYGKEEGEGEEGRGTGRREEWNKYLHLVMLIRDSRSNVSPKLRSSQMMLCRKSKFIVVFQNILPIKARSKHEVKSENQQLLLLS